VESGGYVATQTFAVQEIAQILVVAHILRPGSKSRRTLSLSTDGKPKITDLIQNGSISLSIKESPFGVI
jgi:hypothetical protein